jgi:hypothetical protein
MDEGAQLSNDTEVKVVDAGNEEEELEYMPPTAIGTLLGVFISINQFILSTISSSL